MKLRKTFIAILTLVSVSVSNVSATGYPVFDISGWLAAVDQLYQQYDMVMNAVTQIENQYTQIQQAVERAKSIDWENIRFDGDFDIRNDIKDANRRINALLTQSRRIKETLTSQSIDCGGVRYSIADLCGMGSADHNFFSACLDVKKYMSDGMDIAIKAITEGLSDKQKAFIWRKYGISPRNYLFVQQTVSQVQTQAAKMIAKATEDAVQMNRESIIAKTNAIIQAAYSQLDSNGNMTEAASLEATLHLNQQIIDGIMNLGESLNDMAGMVAARFVNEENEKQADADEMRQEQLRQEAFDYKLPDSFRK